MSIHLVDGGERGEKLLFKSVPRLNRNGVTGFVPSLLVISRSQETLRKGTQQLLILMLRLRNLIPGYQVAP